MSFFVHIGPVKKNLKFTFILQQLILRAKEVGNEGIKLNHLKIIITTTHLETSLSGGLGLGLGQPLALLVRLHSVKNDRSEVSDETLSVTKGVISNIPNMCSRVRHT